MKPQPKLQAFLLFGTAGQQRGRLAVRASQSSKIPLLFVGEP